MIAEIKGMPGKLSGERLCATCGCGLHPDYARRNRWNHGFATLEFDGDKWWKIHNHRILEGRVV